MSYNDSQRGRPQLPPVVLRGLSVKRGGEWVSREDCVTCGWQPSAVMVTERRVKDLGFKGSDMKKNLMQKTVAGGKSKTAEGISGSRPGKRDEHLVCCCLVAVPARACGMK